MKKIILSAFVLSMAIAIHAQEIPERKGEKPGLMERKRHHRGMEMKNLNLTEDQKVKFKTQNENFRKQMEELKKNENITVKDWKAKAENLKVQHKASIQSILTTEQKAQMEKNRAEAKSRHEGMDKNRGDKMNRGERMKTELGLSADQSAKLESNRKVMMTEMKAIRENKSLSDEQKKEQMRELHKKQKENMKSILTEEQLKKMKEGRPQRDGIKKNPDSKQSI